MIKKQSITIDTLAQMMMRQFDTLGKRLDGLETRMDGLEKRMDGLETRMKSVEERLSRVEVDVADVKKGQKSLNYFMKTLGENMANLLKEARKNVLYETFRTLERRVEKLEANL